jgi:tRNA dimethylallyltransferase
VSPLIVVVGPTGSGKSDLALRLAERYRGEIVNCDSVQLYRFLDIGAAKTPVHERRGIPHHLIDILNPDEHFTAGDYSRVARPILFEIASRGRVPMVVGGTGFYLRALLHGLFHGPSRDQALRQRLARRSGDRLHRILSRFDPVAAKRIHSNDVNKLIRALEVCLLAKRPLTEMFATAASEPLVGFGIIKLGLDPPRDELNRRLDERCVRMFEGGILDEVRRLLSAGFRVDSKALMSIGYRESVLHLQGFLDLKEAVERVRLVTRQYAKRQRTWFRREPEVLWLKGFGSSGDIIEAAIRHIDGVRRNLS